MAGPAAAVGRKLTVSACEGAYHYGCAHSGPVTAKLCGLDIRSAVPVKPGTLTMREAPAAGRQGSRRLEREVFAGVPTGHDEGGILTFDRLAGHPAPERVRQARWYSAATSSQFPQWAVIGPRLRNGCVFLSSSVRRTKSSSEIGSTTLAP